MRKLDDSYEFEYTQHALDRIAERKLKPIKPSKTVFASSKTKKWINEHCKTRNYKVTFFRSTGRQPFTIYVCEPIAAKKYKVITAFLQENEN